LKEVKKDIFRRLRVNEMIISKEIRLVGDKGEQLGIMPLSQAKEMARKNNLDLVEVAPTAKPPVCRLLDYGKFKYQQAKKEQEIRKGQRVSLLREIRLRPKIGEHDFESKAKSVRKLLANGDKVKVSVIFRGREITHPELGWKLLQRMAETVGSAASLDRQAAMDGKRMDIILAPSAAAKTKMKEGTKEGTKEAQYAKTENTQRS
jgi:translation initiation factor IF-3